MARQAARESRPFVVSALTLRTNLGKILSRMAAEQRSVVIEKRNAPTAVLLNIRDYVRLAAPEPDILRLIGEEARRNKTSAMTSREIDRVIKATRAKNKAR